MSTILVDYKLLLIYRNLLQRNNSSWNSSSERIHLSWNRLNLTLETIHHSDSGVYEACLINAAGSSCVNFTVLYEGKERLTRRCLPEYV